MGSMIKRMTSPTRELETFIRDHRYDSPYLFIDADVVGCCGNDIEAWSIEGSDGSVAVVYRYGSGAHVIASSLASDVVRAVRNLLYEWMPEMVQCPFEVAQALSDSLQSRFDLVEGHVFRSAGGHGSHPLVSRAMECELPLVAQLICEDAEIGKHYTVQKLASQLLWRERREGCRSFVLKRNGAVVAHAATYAESANAAVIGGVKTGALAKKGDGAAVLSALANFLESGGKEVFLYCYIPALWQWYQAKGWVPVAHVAKFELRKESDEG